MANICRYCKNVIPEGAKRCPSCGKAVVNTCATCGTRVYNDEKYCPGCGAPILVNCSNCGEKIYNGERFCPYCGTKNAKGSASASAPAAGAAPQVNVPISLPVVPPMPPMMNPMGPGFYGPGPMGPSMYGGTPGMPIVLPPIPINPDGSFGEPAAHQAKPERVLRTRPAPHPEETKRKEVVYEGVRTGTVGLILSLFAILFCPTVIMPIISLIVSVVGVRVDKKRKRGIGPGVAGVIISTILLLAIIGVVVYGVFFGGWNTLVENVLYPQWPDVAWPVFNF